MFTVTNKYHTLQRKAGLRAAPGKTFFLEESRVSWSCYIPRWNPTHCKTSKRFEKSQLTRKQTRSHLKVPGCLGLCSWYIKNLDVDSQPFHDLIKDSTPFHWTHEHEKLFQSIKDRISEDTIIAVPSTENPFHINVDSSNVGTGCILIQQFHERKRIISFISRVFDKAEQKMSTFHWEQYGIVSAIQTYEHYVIWSLFSIYLYCDQKPILHLWGRKPQLFHWFFR